MPSAEEVILAWDAPRYVRQAAAEYLAAVRKGGDDERQLFATDAYRRYLSGRARQQRDTVLVRRFLRQLQAERPDLAGLPLPSQPIGRPPARRKHPCPLVADFVGTCARWTRKDVESTLYQMVETIRRLTGKPSELVEPADFCRPEVIESVRVSLLVGDERSQSRRYYPLRHFLRMQAAAAGLAPAVQLDLLARIRPACIKTRTRRRKARSPLCLAYLEHLTANGLAKETTRHARRLITAFEEWALRAFPELADQDGHLVPSRLKAGDIVEYRKWLEVRRSARERSRRLLQLRDWLRWLIANGYCQDERVLTPLARINRPHRPRPYAWNPSEVLRFRNAVLSGGDVRDMALFGLMCVTGARPGEVLSLKLEDWDPVLGRVRYLGKGRERWVFVRSSRVHADLERYLAHRPLPQLPGDDRIFLKPNGFGMRLDGLGEIFHHYRVQAGIQVRVPPLVLRHTFATMLLEEGVPLTLRMEIMGHKQPNSQMYYTKNSFRAAAHRALGRYLDARAHR